MPVSLGRALVSSGEEWREVFRAREGLYPRDSGLFQKTDTRCNATSPASGKTDLFGAVEAPCQITGGSRSC